MPRPPREAFAFFADPANLEAITPPWLSFRIVESPPELRTGSLIRYRLRLHGVPIEWLTEIREWTPPRGFVDVQVRGPYLLWEHTHRLTRRRGGTEIYDHVRYRAPAGRLAEPWVRRQLDAIFDFRVARVHELLG